MRPSVKPAMRLRGRVCATEEGITEQVPEYPEYACGCAGKKVPSSGLERKEHGLWFCQRRGPSGGGPSGEDSTLGGRGEGKGLEEWIQGVPGEVGEWGHSSEGEYGCVARGGMKEERDLIVTIKPEKREGAACPTAPPQRDEWCRMMSTAAEAPRMEQPTETAVLSSCCRHGSASPRCSF